MYVALGLPSIDLGVNLDISTPVDANSLLGVTHYSGTNLLTTTGGGNTALSLRSFIFDGSFYVGGKVGYMETVTGHNLERSDAYEDFGRGASYGLEIGNHWFKKNGFHHGVTWAGYDGYLRKSKADGLIHLTRYELGFSF